EKFAKEYKALQQSLGVNGNEVASNAAKISQAYGSFSAVIEVVGQRITQTFAPAIERVVKGFRDWIDAHSETLTGIMQSLAKALEWVGDKLVVIADWTTDKGKLFGDFWLKTYGYIQKIVDVVKVLLNLLFKLNAAMMAGPVGKYMDFMFGGGLAGKLLGGSAQAAEGAAIGGASYLGQEPANDTGKAKPGLLRRGIDAMKRAVGLGPKQDKSDYNFTGENVDVLRQAAKELGTSPKDLATVISYESKFSPSVHGGTGNRYHGLIQFGGPERAMYGANDKQTFKEQMPAVVRYLKSRGFKPGMGLLDLYSTINAGRPGRYDASDGHGTVRSHVAKMERDEAARVARFLSSGSGTTAAPVAPRPIAGGFNPGSFDVNAYLRSTPLGATSTTNNQSSMNVNSPTNVTIHGVTDPQKAAEHFERAANRSNNEMLRNVQTAAR
ncbi:hypothetical protein MKK64_01850, partial [Methylobacterium sp. E-025]|uniref:hypothetical protein n=1 Tax=Methylobacterium sp. E-025 TaxID=2836561 RepID=UPI001FBA8BDC